MALIPKILAFAGSTRNDSYNKKLVRIAAESARQAGAETTLLDLRDLALPIFDEDLEREQGLPPGGRRIKDLLESHHGLLISSPEYNSSISAALKNAIDWASRPEPGKPPLSAFTGKVAGLMSASPGALGGLRGLVHLRAILGNINVLVLPEQRAIANAAQEFDEKGDLRDPAKREQIASLAARVVAVTRKMIA